MKREDFLELMHCFIQHQHALQQALAFGEAQRASELQLFNTMLSHDLNEAYSHLSSEERVSIAHCLA